MNEDVMDEAEKLLENPVMRLLAALSLMLIAERAIAGLIFGLTDLTDLFQSLIFDSLWNLPQGAWLAIAIVLGGWIVLGSMRNLDPGLIGGAAGAFFFMSVLIANFRGDLPDVLRDLYDLLPPALFLVGVAAGLIALLKSSPASGGESGSFATSAAPPPSGFATGPSMEPAPAPAPFAAPAPAPAPAPFVAPAPAPAPLVAPAPAPAPTPAPAPAPQAPLGGQEPCWLPDPRGEAELRWWDGSMWTDHIHNS